MYYLLDKYANQELKLFLEIPPVMSTKGACVRMETSPYKTDFC